MQTITKTGSTHQSPPDQAVKNLAYIFQHICVRSSPVIKLRI